MSYRISDDAETDLLAIWGHTAKTWSEVQADLYIDAFLVRFAWLTKNVGLWTTRPEIGEGLYSYLQKSHVIIFRKKNQCLEILRILHNRMDLKKHI